MGGMGGGGGVPPEEGTPPEDPEAEGMGDVEAGDIGKDMGGELETASLHYDDKIEKLLTESENVFNTKNEQLEIKKSSISKIKSKKQKDKLIIERKKEASKKLA